MKDPWQSAGEALAAILTEENSALSALDVKRAVVLLETKSARIAAFEALRPTPAGRGPAVALLEQLSVLAAENRRLLDRAIKAQGRVIGILAGLVRQTPMAPRYGAHGTLRPQRAPLTMTLSARV